MVVVFFIYWHAIAARAETIKAFGGFFGRYRGRIFHKSGMSMYKYVPLFVCSEIRSSGVPRVLAVEVFYCRAATENHWRVAITRAFDDYLWG